MNQNEYRFWMATVIGWALFTFAFTADRVNWLLDAGWLSYFAFLSCMTFSALFELLESGATLIAGAGGDEFLGHQGDVWDAQWDILWALIGSVLSLLLLSNYHSKQLRTIDWVGACSHKET